MPRAWYTANRLRVHTKRVSIFFGVLVALWLISHTAPGANILHGIQEYTYRAGAALGRVTSRIFTPEDSLFAQVNVCTNRLEAAVAQSADAYAHQQEVKEWRALMRYEERVKQQGITAHIIARDTPEESVVTIDHGAQDGVTEGAAVVVGDGMLFGVVHTVAATSSTVRLTAHNMSAIPAAILGEETTIGLVVGKEGALLSMEYIPQSVVLAKHNVVVTSGLGGRIRNGIVIGTIDDVIATPSAPFLRATIRPVHDPRVWTAVVVLPYPEKGL